MVSVVGFFGGKLGDVVGDAWWVEGDEGVEVVECGFEGGVGGVRNGFGEFDGGADGEFHLFFGV